MSKKILLIVEDEEDMQDLMKLYIKKEGLDIEIKQAFDGTEGVKIYRELMKKGKKPDLVIMDLKLPVMDGVQATKEIMKIDPKANIYGFTAYFDTDMSRELERAGAKKIIPRHEGFKKFIEEIKEFFGYQ